MFIPFKAVDSCTKSDIRQVMQIWFNGNVEAHPFIPKAYWQAFLLIKTTVRPEYADSF